MIGIRICNSYILFNTIIRGKARKEFFILVLRLQSTPSDEGKEQDTKECRYDHTGDRMNLELLRE